jgi:UPF0755 protein
MKKKILAGLFLFLLILGIGFFYFRSQIYFSHGELKKNTIFEIKKGESTSEIGKDLFKRGIIHNQLYFLAYFAINRNTKAIYPGEYLISGDLTIPEIAAVVTNPKKVYEKVLFKEGWTAKLMAGELDAHGFSGQEFLAIVDQPSQDIISQFKVLSDKPQPRSLEGYLFPDTYYFSKEATTDGIMKKILSNTENKIDDSLLGEIKKQGKTIFDIITMASIVEKEVSTDEDRAIVSGLFWNRIAAGQPLQSDAPLSYILDDKNSQHSIAETKLDSPYNTYANKGLPLGPISNPGLSAIRAAVYPKDSPYNYFLSDPKTSKTVFSKTFEEHVANRQKYGL